MANIRSLYLFYLLFTANVYTILCDCSALSNNYVIKSTSGDYIVDGTNENQVTIQHYSGSAAQRFQIVCGTRAGLFYLVNDLTGNVLDVERSTYPHNVVLAPKDGTMWQEWFLNANGRVVNVALQSVLEITNGVFEAGTNVRVLQDNGSEAQEWVLENV